MGRTCNSVWTIAPATNSALSAAARKFLIIIIMCWQCLYYIIYSDLHSVELEIQFLPKIINICLVRKRKVAMSSSAQT